MICFEFYGQETRFPADIASSLGMILATIHQCTYRQQDHQAFFEQDGPQADVELGAGLTQGFGSDWSRNFWGCAR